MSHIVYVGLRSLPSAARNRVAVVIAIATSRCMPPVSAVKTVHYSTASHLEEVFHPTEPFRVSAFAAHRERVAFKPHAGGEELLTRAGPLTLDDIRPEERDVAASDHPLHSLRPARQGVRRGTTSVPIVTTRITRSITARDCAGCLRPLSQTRRIGWDCSPTAQLHGLACVEALVGARVLATR